MSDDEDYEYEYDDDADDNDDEAMGGGEKNDGDVEMDDDNEEEEEEEEEFEYTDDEEDVDDVDVALENAYYNAKSLRETDLSEAASAFEELIKMERKALEEGTATSSSYGGGGGESKAPYGQWSFKALKQLVKLRLRTGEDLLDQYNRMLECVASGAVSPNAVEKGVNGMLERVSGLYQGTSGSSPNSSKLQLQAKQVYDATLQLFHPSQGRSPNERLWFKTNLKYGQLLYEMNETAKLQLVIRDLLRSSGLSESTSATSDDDGMTSAAPAGASSSSSSSSNTHLMEIYALQIQLYSRQKDNKKLREIFGKAMRVQGGIPHPRTLALIQELGGKMHMASREFEAAGKTFFQAFKSYDEAGDPSRLRCLKYLVMASMLHASSINPFDSQEARPYRDDPEIVAMTNLVQAFHNNEIRTFEGILRRNEGRLMDDEFVREHVADLLRTIRTQVLQKLIGPYTRIRLSAIAKELNDIPVPDVESLLVGLILDGKLQGRIDQVNGILVKCRGSGTGTDADGGGGSGGGTLAATAAATRAGTSSGATGAAGSSSGATGASSGAEAVGRAPTSAESMDKFVAAAEASLLSMPNSAQSMDAALRTLRNYAAMDHLATSIERLTVAVTNPSVARATSSNAPPGTASFRYWERRTGTAVTH